MLGSSLRYTGGRCVLGSAVLDPELVGGLVTGSGVDNPTGSGLSS